MEIFKTYLVVMLGGTLGVAARLWMSSVLAGKLGETFPVGTLAVNILGSFLIGLFTGVTGPDGVWLVSPRLRQAVTVGVLGGYTTFSSFSLETIHLLNGRQFWHASLNILLSVGLCLLACWCGLKLALAFKLR